MAEQEHFTPEKACSDAVTHTSTSKSTNKTFSNSQITSALQAVKNTRRRTSLRPKDVEAINKINSVLKEMQKNTSITLSAATKKAARENCLKANVQRLQSKVARTLEYGQVDLPVAISRAYMYVFIMVLIMITLLNCFSYPLFV